MAALLRASLFLALAAGEFNLISTRIVPLPGFSNNAQILSAPGCFQQPGAASYPFLGEHLNALNCRLNSVFQAAAHGPLVGKLQMTTFGALLLASIMIGEYESFRPSHRRSNPIVGIFARATSLFLLAGQRFTAGFTTPVQCIFTTLSNASAKVPGAMNVPSAEHIWSTLIATTLGYLVPTVYSAAKNMDFVSLTVWQPFPLYILALNLVLPSVLKKTLLPALPFSRNQSRRIGVLLIAALCIVVSAGAHWELLSNTIVAKDGVDIRDVFLRRRPAEEIVVTMAHAAHALFLVDFMAVLVAAILAVVPAMAGGIIGFFRNLIVFAFLTVGAGPGAAVAVIWASAELARLRTSVSQTTKSQ